MFKRSLISLIIALVVGTASAMAGDADNKADDSLSRNIFAEFMGPSCGIGIGYDQRFKPTSRFGFRAGLAFTNGSWDYSDGLFDTYYYRNVDFKGATLPLEVNAIFGKRASKFELGIGVTPCILKRHDVKMWMNYYDDYRYEVTDKTRLNILGAINIGYRLQRTSGFFLRTGLTLLLGDLNCSPIDGVLLAPNISIGYTLR